MSGTKDLNPYRYADEQRALSLKNAAAAFHNMRLAFFDEIDAIQTIEMSKKMYAKLDRDNRQRYLMVANRAYKEAWGEAKGIVGVGEREPIKPSRDWLTALLAGYYFVSKYVYAHEVERKAARFAEAILSDRAGGRVANSSQFRQALRLWMGQVDQYYINVVDKARVKAFKDAGVKQVVWVTMGDEKVCEDCYARDGKVYDIDKIPEKTHYGCRCTVEIIVIKEGFGGDDE